MLPFCSVLPLFIICSMLRAAIFTLLLAAAARADTPANCSYSDIKGDWLFYSSDATGDNSIECTDASEWERGFTWDLWEPSFTDVTGDSSIECTDASEWERGFTWDLWEPSFTDVTGDSSIECTDASEWERALQGWLFGNITLLWDPGPCVVYANIFNSRYRGCRGLCIFYFKSYVGRGKYHGCHKCATG